MPKSIKAIQSIFSIIILILGWGGWYLLKSIYPAMEMAWYPFMPVTFWIMGMILSAVLENVKKDNPRKLVNVYMMLKLSKIVIAMGMILIYYFLFKEEIKTILFAFVFYYALYLLLEFYAFYITEKNINKVDEKIL